MSSLAPVGGGDAPVTRCACGREAAGPCARCRRSVCGDCCELVTGGATTFAVCLTCLARGDVSMTRAWAGLLGWLGLIILALAGVAGLIVLLRG